MRIQHTCIRCRRTSHIVEIQGANPLFNNFMSFSGQAMCPHCGGWVHEVKDDEVLPYEFVASTRRVLRASIWSALKMSIVWFGVAFVIGFQADGVNLISPLVFCALGAICGFILPQILSRIARRQRQVNTPHRPGSMPVGEAMTNFALILPSLVVCVMLFVFIFPMLSSVDTEMPGVMERCLSGVFAGFVTAMTSSRELFRQGRKPPSEDKVWQLGEEPE